MPDPFEALRAPLVPTDPDPTFAARLRARLERALALPEGADMTQPTTDRAAVAAAGVATDAAPPARPRRHPHGTRHGDIGYISFEVPDLDRATTFYGTVLGWTFAAGESEQGRLVVDSVPMTNLWGGQPRGLPVVCWRVDDLEATLVHVRRAGGAAGDPDPRPYGQVSDCVDDQGMRFYLWEPPEELRSTTSEVAGPSGQARDGDIVYLTLGVPDDARFRAFFGAVLGWRFSPGRTPGGWNIHDPAPMAGLSSGAETPTAVPMFRVGDVQAAVGRVRSAGGRASDVEAQPYGLSSRCTDDQGTTFYLGQV